MDQSRVRPGLSVARPIIMFFFLCPFRPVCVDDAATNEAVGRMNSNNSAFLLFFFFTFALCILASQFVLVPWIQVEGAVSVRELRSGTKSREITAVLACKHLAPPSTVILVPVLLYRKWQQNGPEIIAPGQKDCAVLDAYPSKQLLGACGTPAVWHDRQRACDRAHTCGCPCTRPPLDDGGWTDPLGILAARAWHGR
jgi:hypothetical protein